MREIVRTNEPVLLSYIESLMRDADIDFMVADRNISIMEGSIGIFPRRVLVDSDKWPKARMVLIEAGLEQWISHET